MNSHRVVSLVDLCGHEKYLKTTMFGMSGLYPNYAMLIIGANMGISRMTKEHIGIALALKVPLLIVITKIDLAPSEILDNTLNDVKKIIGSCKMKSIIMKDNKEEI